jgi:hypothetical protein
MYVFLIQKAHLEELTGNANIITIERLKEIANFALYKAAKELSYVRPQNCLQYIAALSDYPDQLFNFRNVPLPQQLVSPINGPETAVDGKQIDLPVNTLLQASFEKLSFRAAFNPFM